MEYRHGVLLTGMIERIELGYVDESGVFSLPG